MPNIEAKQLLNGGYFYFEDLNSKIIVYIVPSYT